MSKQTIIRRALQGDEESIASVHIKSWQEAYKGIVPQEYLDQLPSKLDDHITMWTGVIANPQRWTWIAENSNGIVGFILFGPPRDKERDGFIELGAIYLLFSEKGKGIGFELLSSGFKKMRELGYGKAYCWVLENNPTIKFYERTGAEFLGQVKEDEIGGKKFNEFAYEWDSLELEIQFKPVNENHIPLLRRWLKEPHVAEFWQEPEEETEFKQKYLGRLQARDVRPYIIIYKGRPIGYMQDYEAALVGGGWWPNAKPGTFGIDQYIGEHEFVNMGLGTKMIHQFVARLFENPNVIEIITDPDPKNSRAIRVYEKVGFKKVGPISTPGGDAMLMVVSRDEFDIQKPDFTIRTDRLTLRQYQADDWERVHIYGSNPDFSKDELWGPNTIEDTKKYVSEMIEQRKSQPRFKFDFAVCLKESGILIGGCGIRRESESSQVASLGWAINPEFQNRGYAIEAAKALIEYGFHELNLSVIYATCDTRNASSYKVMEKLGMKNVGFIKGTKEVKGHFRDLYRYEILNQKGIK